jgi:hypothetical protein
MIGHEEPRSRSLRRAFHDREFSERRNGEAGNALSMSQAHSGGGGLLGSSRRKLLPL